MLAQSVLEAKIWVVESMPAVKVVAHWGRNVLSRLLDAVSAWHTQSRFHNIVVLHRTRGSLRTELVDLPLSCTSRFNFEAATPRIGRHSMEARTDASAPNTAARPR